MTINKLDPDPGRAAIKNSSVQITQWKDCGYASWSVDQEKLDRFLEQQQQREVQIVCILKLLVLFRASLAAALGKVGRVPEYKY